MPGSSTHRLLLCAVLVIALGISGCADYAAPVYGWSGYPAAGYAPSFAAPYDYGAVGFGGLALALWSASRGMSGLITALNIAYKEKERRGFFKLNLLALGLTVALVLGGLVVIALVAVLPAPVQLIGLGGAAKWLLLVLEWPLLIVVVMFGLTLIYRYAPDRQKLSGGGYRRALSQQQPCGTSGPSHSPSMSPISTATTKPMARWAV
jgi:hypothetical protein